MSSGPTYTPVNWALTGVAGALTIGRYAIRYFNSRRFYWDDAVHLFALVILIVHGGTNQLSLASKAKIADAVSEKPKPSESYLLGLYEHNQRLSTVNNCFLYLVFWIVKFSFLVFYRFLFHTSAPFDRVWLGVTVLTFLTYWIPFAGVLTTCAGAHTVAAYKECSGQTHGREVKLEYSCAFNVFTDLAIMGLPIWMLKDLKISIAQKTGLAFIFSLAIVCVALDIIRVIEAVKQNQALYTIIEINFVVIISCLPTYRALLGIGQRRKSSRPSSNYPWRSREEGQYFTKEDGDEHPLQNRKPTDVDESGNFIHVSTDLKVSSGALDPYSPDSLNASAQPVTGAVAFH